MKTQKGIIHLGLILVLLIFGIGALVFVIYKTNSLPAITASSSTPNTIIDNIDQESTDRANENGSHAAIDISKYKQKLSSERVYEDRTIGYSVTVPSNFDVYSSLSDDKFNKVSVLVSKTCEKVDNYIFSAHPSNPIGDNCSFIKLPYLIGTTGWGYGNLEQKQIMIKIDGYNTRETYFVYPDSILYSWVFDVSPINIEVKSEIDVIMSAFFYPDKVPNYQDDISIIKSSLKFTN